MNKHIPALALLGAITLPASGVTVISNAIEDLNHLAGAARNRNEMILNNTGSNTGRFGLVRFDTAILAAQAFTDPSQYTLTSATVTLNEEAGRNGNNAALPGTVYSYFMNTTENSDWSVTSNDSVDSANAGTGTVGTGYFGNSLARPGNFGNAAGPTNVDSRSNGAANALTGFWGGASSVAHTFDAGNSNEQVTINLTQGGATLAELQSILADWVAGSNAGIGFGAEFGNQSFFQSNNINSGDSVGSTIDGVNTASGVGQDRSDPASGGIVNNGNNAVLADGDGNGTSFLTLKFTAVVPEPSTALLSAFAALGLLRRRR